MVVLGMFAPKLILRFNLRRTLIFAQLSGILSLGIVYLGFATQDFVLAMVGMICAGVPTVLLNIISTSVFKIQSDQPEYFRKLQGAVSTIAGACFLFAAILAPLIVHAFGLSWILALDACTYLIGGLYLASEGGAWIVNLNGDPQTDGGPKAATHAAAQTNAVWKSPIAVQFFLLAISAYLLVGVMPLVASSNDTLWGATLSSAGLRSGSLWCLEALSILSAGLVYARIAANRKLGAILDLPVPPAILLMPLFFVQDSVALIVFLLFFTALFTQLKFMRTRDNFLLVARSSDDTVRASALAIMVGNGLMFLSPLLVVPLIAKTATPVLSLAGLVCVLAVLYLAGALHAAMQKLKSQLA